MGSQNNEEAKKKVSEIYNQIKKDEMSNGIRNYGVYKISVPQMVKFREVVLYILNKNHEK